MESGEDEAKGVMRGPGVASEQIWILTWWQMGYCSVLSMGKNGHICILGQFLKLHFILKLCETCILHNIQKLRSSCRPSASLCAVAGVFTVSLERQLALIVRRTDWVEVCCMSA